MSNGSDLKWGAASRRAFLALCVALALSGCDPVPKPSGGENPGNTTPAVSGAPDSGAKKPTIAVIPKGLTHVFWQSVRAGAEKAGAEFGANIKWDGPQKESDTAGQIAVVENAINSKVDGIVLAPLDQAALVGVIKKAKEAKIPLTVFDSAAATEEYVSFVATDNVKGGEMAADRLGEILGGKGKVALIPLMANSASTMDRESGFEKRMKEKFPNIVVVRSNYGMSDRAQSLKVSEDVLSANPDIVGIFGSNESSTVGALQAVKNKGLTGKIKLVGFDNTKQLEDSIGKGEIDSLVIQNPTKMGYEGVKTIMDLKAGKTPEKRVDTGVVLMTKANRETPEMADFRAK